MVAGGIGKGVAGPLAIGSLLLQEREAVDSDSMLAAAIADTGCRGKGIADLEVAGSKVAAGERTGGP